MFTNKVGVNSKAAAHYHLNQLTEYYDTETREFKKQSKIIFNMKIISPKLDEIAKDQHVESGNLFIYYILFKLTEILYYPFIEYISLFEGIEDSDMEKEEDEKDSVNGK